MRKNSVFFALFLCSVLFFGTQTAQAFEVVDFHADYLRKKCTVVLDAGHGGEDGGTVGVSGVLEKDVNLAVALMLRDLLIQNDFSVIMTREVDDAIGDKTLPTVAERKRSDTKKRLRIIEEAGDCLFVSIHQNYFQESQYSGAQVFYSGNREESAVLAEAIRSSIVESLQPDNRRQNKLAEGNIYLLKNCKVPGVLVECGFLSNPEEEQRLRDPLYQADMAAAIYNGIVAFLEQREN